MAGDSSKKKNVKFLKPEKPAKQKQESELFNPTLIDNWPPSPHNLAEFDQWLEVVRDSLLEWLKESQGRALEVKKDEQNRDEPVEERTACIEKFTAYANATWAGWASQTDVQTGTIYNRDQRDAMETAMAEVRKRREALHAELGTWRRFVEYRYAQAAWEDFLHYQNVWNRKDYRPNFQYQETAADTRIRMHRESLDAAKRRLAELAAQTGGPMDDASSDEDRDLEEIEAKRGTPGSRRLLLGDDIAFWKCYERWLAEIIRVFQEFKLGYRKTMPATIEPSIAHRYSQPTRGTTPQKLDSYQIRHQYLEERFPRQRRKAADVTEVEESRRPQTERQRDRGLEMVPLAWTLNDVAVSALRDTIDLESGFRDDERTRRLLPQDHIHHHGCLESSFDWPTSFDSSRWGPILSKIGMQEGYVLQMTSDDEGEPLKANRSKPKNKAMRPRLDADGSFMKVLESKRRYELHDVSVHGTIFTHDKYANGKVKGRTRRGDWKGESRQGVYPEPRWKLDDNGARIVLKPEAVRKSTYTTWTEATGVRLTRLERHQKKEKDDQLSETEDDDCIDGNDNFGRSGNMNPDQVGNPTYWTDDEDSDTASDPGDSDDEESDDDGDLFRLSYEECSECPYKKKAREMLAALREELGVYEHLTEEQLIPWLKDGMEYDEMKAQYSIFMTASLQTGA